MVELRSSGNFQLDSDDPGRSEKMAVIEDVLEEEHAPLAKKSKNAALSQEEGSHCNTVGEPMPLGLRLEKTPSLLELIQAKFAEQDSVTIPFLSTIEDSGRRSFMSANVSGTTDRPRALHFEANLLRIGNWKHVSKYPGDLLVKCYYAKRKLVWEILDGGLKSKIEIQCSEITSLKATYPENGDGILDVVLSSAPHFYKEIDPRPRRHTLWEEVTDFTGGQASVYRRHYLECHQGLLRRNIRELLQWDSYLNSMSQQPDTTLDYPFFKRQCSVFDDHGFDNMRVGNGPTFFGFYDLGSSGATSSISMKSAVRQDFVVRSNLVWQETPSPSTGQTISALGLYGASVVVSVGVPQAHTGSETEQMKEPNRMAVSDLVNPRENRIFEEMAWGNPWSSRGTLPTKAISQHIPWHLPSDSEGSSVVDKQQFDFPILDSSLSLLKPQNPSNNDADSVPVTEVVDVAQPPNDGSMTVDDAPDPVPTTELGGAEQPPPSPPPSEESYGEFLMNLPRIASLPRLFDSF